MGNSSTSSLCDEDKDFFDALCGPKSVPVASAFWKDAFTKLSQRKLILLEPHSALAVNRLTRPFCGIFHDNNKKTRNLQAFLHHLITRLRVYSFPAASADSEATVADVIAAANGLYIGHIVLHHLIKQPTPFGSFFADYPEDAPSDSVRSPFEDDDLHRNSTKETDDDAVSASSSATRRFRAGRNSILHESLIFELLEVLVKICCQQNDPPHQSLKKLPQAQVAIYILRLEVLHTLLILMSSDLYAGDTALSTAHAFSPGPAAKAVGRVGRGDASDMCSPLELLLRKGTARIPGGGHWAMSLLPSLLSQITVPRAPPSADVADAIRIAASQHEHMTHVPATGVGSSSSSSSVLGSVADSVFRLPLHLFHLLFLGTDAEAACRSPISERCLLVLLVLVHSRSRRHGQSATNPYKTVFCALADTDTPSTPGVRNMGLVHISFNRLYEALSDRSRMRSPQGVLLLYSLLQWNQRFREYILARSDPEALLLPLLEQLHRPADLDQGQLYLIIIIILLFTQDAMFNDNAHQQVVIAEVSWFESRRVTNISLGSLMFIVCMGVLQYNMAQYQDPHVHTYCTAALANMGPHCQKLHHHAAQKLVGLIHVLSRKYFHLTNLLDGARGRLDGDSGHTHAAAAAAASARTHSETKPAAVVPDEMRFLADACHELLRAMFDLVLWCVSERSLRHNLNLVYVLLHERRIFRPFCEHSTWGTLVRPLVAMLDHLYAELESHQLPEDWSYESVMKQLEEAVTVWKGPALGSVAVGDLDEDNKFKYEEADGAGEFFVPCVWQAIMAHTGDIDWEPDRASMHFCETAAADTRCSRASSASPEGASAAATAALSSSSTAPPPLPLISPRSTAAGVSLPQPQPQPATATAAATAAATTLLSTALGTSGNDDDAGRRGAVLEL